MTERGTRIRFITAALAVSLSILVAGASGYLFVVKHYRVRMARHLFEYEFVRAYLFDPGFRRLADALAFERSTRQADVLAAFWGTNGGVVLSRTLFDSVDMYGAHTYVYKSNLRKLSSRGAAGGLEWTIETNDTPEIRSALTGTNPGTLVAASYDAFGHRRADDDLTRDCETGVMFLGDSYTDGMWVSDGETFVNVYGHLARDRSHVRVCPVNAGVNGYGSPEESSMLERSFETAGRPAIVILMYYPNDVDEFERAVVDGTLPGLDAKWQKSLSYLRRAAAFCRAHGSRLVVAAIPPKEQFGRPATREHYQDVLRLFCEREGLLFVDLFAGLEARPVRLLYWDWDPHFTPAGHRAVAEILYEGTRSLLAPRFPVQDTARSAPTRPE
jgi:lysophospholipase L1-like esterase